MTSDFPRAAARVSEGFCPLCDRRLGDTGNPDDLKHCGLCKVSWALTVVEGRAHLWPSRQLTPEEIKALYARPESDLPVCPACDRPVQPEHDFVLRQDGVWHQECAP